MKGSRARTGRAASAVLAAGVLAAVLTACGASASSREASAERQSAANLAGLIDQLHEDLAVTELEGDSLAAARRALRSYPDQVAALVAFDDFGSCRTMVRNAGSAVGRLHAVAATLASACRLLERAAELFTVAQTSGDAQVLLRASERALAATPLLYRARVQLAAARRA
ncbi:MAG TPA: hypothetical protein VFA88_08260 [Gaiellaceae bacterium]|nr:hypothetical protein [Gaiellaceae bacterium]